MVLKILRIIKKQVTLTCSPQTWLPISIAKMEIKSIRDMKPSQSLSNNLNKTAKAIEIKIISRD